MIATKKIAIVAIRKFNKNMLTMETLGTPN